MTARFCPNCNCIKEVSELKERDEIHCVCLTCGKSFSFTEKNKCKFGHIFGKDCDWDEACFDCLIWDDCYKEQQRIKNAPKKSFTIPISKS